MNGLKHYIKMLGVQSCKNFGWSSEALGIGHPSGALEDGARVKFLNISWGQKKMLSENKSAGNIYTSVVGAKKNADLTKSAVNMCFCSWGLKNADLRTKVRYSICFYLYW